ncbi:MAG: aminotransferase class I/II-fold pyridoxal phosphate-dependent enzyme [Phycisphaerales bacterium]|nr:aminotransferase class I/II-fold pyridoxal phosphate-dependent enzyme [Phycisphaerales bacterium]
MTAFDPMRAIASVRHEFGEHGGVNLSIETSSTFTVMQAGAMPELFQGMRGPEAGGCYLYGRHFNPTVLVLARQLAALEQTQAAYCTASGMAAISGVLLQACDTGDHIVASDTLYGGTWALLHDFLPTKAGIRTTFVDATQPEKVAAAVTRRTKVVYVESVSNPSLRVADVPALARVAHDAGALLVVDNTFAPVVLSPARHGADIVVHSLTKFVNGASDLVAGAVCAPRDIIDRLFDLHHGALMLLGPTMDPRAAYEIAMRLPHLGLRMREHGRRALAFAERMRDRGLRVTYPGLEDHPDHALLQRLANPGYGFGGMLTIDMGTTERANALMETLQNQEGFGYMAVSLGYADTLMSCSAASTSSELDEAGLAEAGISPGLVRLSIGYTGTIEDRWAELERGLAGVPVHA